MRTGSQKKRGVAALTDTYWVNMARGYAAGVLSRKEIEGEAGDYGWEKVQRMINNDVLAWAEAYQKQEPEKIAKFVAGVIPNGHVVYAA